MAGVGVFRASCVIALSLAAAGCVTNNWTVEDWDLSYKQCEIKLDWHDGRVKCKWKVTLLGT